MNVILCGPPMSGKTSIGKQLARKLGYPFIDTDRLIEQGYVNAKMSCRKIYQEIGEKEFRVLEKLQIGKLFETQNSVIAIGGGALEDLESRHLLQQLGWLIYLRVPLNVLWERLKAKELPAYLNKNSPKKDFERLMEKRTQTYEAVSNKIFDAFYLSEHEIVEELHTSLKGLNNGQ